MKIALAQIDTTVRAFAENAAVIVRQSREAARAGAQLVLFPELTLCGYPPKDLLALQEFVQRQLAALEQLAADPVFGRVPALVGFAEPHRGEGAGLFNACALLRDGKIAAVARKSLLPTYDVFDEARYFDPSPEVTVVEIAGVRVGLSICEDLWNDKLVFDGHSLAVSTDGETLVEAPGFEERLIFADLSPKPLAAAGPRSTPPLARQKPEPSCRNDPAVATKPDLGALAVVSAYEL